MADPTIEPDPVVAEAPGVGTVVDAGGPSESVGQFSRKMLDLGFGFALVLAGVCLLASVFYLSFYLYEITTGLEKLIDQAAARQLEPVLLEVGINANLATARLALLSCAVFVGMAFGFLGFALFLIGVRGEMDVSARKEGYSVKLARLSPGVFVLLVAAVLIGVAITRKPSFTYSRSQEPAVVEPTPPAAAGARESLARRDAALALRPAEEPADDGSGEAETP